MKTLVPLLEKTMAEYRNMLAFLEKQQAALSNCRPAQIHRAVGRLIELQERIREADAALAEAANGKDPADSPLWPEKVALMQRANDGCHLLLKQIKAIMACLKADLSTIRQSRKAVSGYGGAKRRRGGLVSNAC